MNKKGFTLIEIMIVVVIIVILTGIAIMAGNSARSVARDNQRISDMQLFQLKLEAYHDQNNKYPATLPVLAPVYISTLPADPLPSQSYHYVPLEFKNNSTSCGVNYHLGADLENNNAVLQKAADGINTAVFSVCSGNDFTLVPSRTYDVVSPSVFQH